MRHDLTDLRLFVNVGETLNLTRAAERTFLSLPAASARVKHMEEASRRGCWCAWRRAWR